MGRLINTVVPWPGAVVIVVVPRALSARERRFSSPIPLRTVDGSKTISIVGNRNQHAVGAVFNGHGNAGGTRVSQSIAEGLTDQL